jgi:hypothetical protein
VTDRDDALRRQPGWTGPEESDHDPETRPPGPAEPSPPADSPVPRRPSVDFVPPKPQESAGEPTPADEPGPFSSGPHRLSPEPPPPSQPEGSRRGPGEGPPPFLDPDQPRGTFREPQFGPRPQPPAHDAPQFPPPTAGRVDTGQRERQPDSPGSPQPPTQPPQQPSGRADQPGPAPATGRIPVRRLHRPGRMPNGSASTN